MLEEAIKVHQAQSPCHGQEHLQLDEVAQSPVQSDHEGAQGWVFTTSLDNLLQRFTILTEKKPSVLPEENIFTVDGTCIW